MSTITANLDPNNRNVASLDFNWTKNTFMNSDKGDMYAMALAYLVYSTKGAVTYIRSDGEKEPLVKTWDPDKWFNKNSFHKLYVKEGSKLKVLSIVKNNTAKFLFYRNNIVYYSIIVEEQEYYFPVPLDDLGGATVFAEEKAITLMRYIKKALQDQTFVKNQRK
jgi:hypothetical protein